MGEGWELPYGVSPETDGDSREGLAPALDRAIREVKKADWRGNRFKERELRNAIRAKVGPDDALVEAMFEIVKAQSEY